MASDFPLIGNLLWLDFVNTEPVVDGNRVDLLPRFGDLVLWEPKLLQMYDEILPQMDRALGES